MSAMVFYDPNISDHTFSIYVNRPGISFGYFFRGGGSIAQVEEYITEFRIGGLKERAFVSLNKQKISKIIVDDGNAINTIEIDSTKPFAVVLPVNAGAVTIYDTDGNIIDSIEHNL